MSRVARRIARQLREEWLQRITGSSAQTPFAGQGQLSGRGADYADAADQWVCNRKKAYPTGEMAARVAGRLNAANTSERTARPGFYGVVVNPYSCGRCGFWHLGR